jgi:hypothetical protein
MALCGSASARGTASAFADPLLVALTRQAICGMRSYQRR